MIGARSEARRRLEDAAAAYESLGEQTSAAVARAELGGIAYEEGRLEAGIREMETAYDALSAQRGDHAVASLAAQLARLQFFSGNGESALRYVEHALVLAEAQRLPDVLSEALNTKGLILTAQNRFYEAEVLVRAALEAALDADVPSAALRAYNNLGSLLSYRDRNEEALQSVEPYLALARRVGDRPWEWGAWGGSIDLLTQLGRWDEALARAEDMQAAMSDAGATRAVERIELMPVPLIHVHRGELDQARSVLDLLLTAFRDSDDTQVRAIADSVTGIVREAEGDHASAVDAAQRSFSARTKLGFSHPAARNGFIVGIAAAFALGDLTAVRRYLSVVEEAGPGEAPPAIHAQRARFNARLAELEGRPEAAESGLKEAAGTFREIGMPFWLAVVLLELGELLQSSGRGSEAEPLLFEAREIFGQLQARPWLERLDRVQPATLRVG